MILNRLVRYEIQTTNLDLKNPTKVDANKSKQFESKQFANIKNASPRTQSIAPLRIASVYLYRQSKCSAVVVLKY